MTRHFSIPKILRMTPKPLLHEFFDKIGQPLPSVDWSKVREINPLLVAIGCLPQRARDEIEMALASIFELACQSGTQAILEAARRLDTLPSALPQGAEPYHRAMWVWLHAPELFDRALLVHQVDQLTRWRKRKGIPRVQPRTSVEASAELGQRLSLLLRHEEGRGDKCTVDYFQRQDGTDYYVAYPDDFVQTIILHDERGNLTPRPVRQTFEIIFGYHQHEGTLDLFAKVPSSMKPKLEQLFAQIILGVELAPLGPELPYNLNRLKDRYFCLDTDPEDRLSASIRRLRLDVPQQGRLTVEPAGDGRAESVYQVIDECLNGEKVVWDAVRISMATIRIQFEPISGRHSSALTFDVTYPDRCSINSRRPERIDLARKYLKRWKIANV